MHPELARGVDLFNRGEFFEAHEVVEDLWHEYWEDDRDLLKGWIQAAVCFEHHRRGNLRGMYSVGTTSLGYLRQYSVNGHGLDIATLVADLEAFLDAVERGETPPYPKQKLKETS